MYFEDVYFKISPFWKISFTLENIEQTKSYVESIRRNYNEIEYIVDFKNKKNFTEWERMLVFTMYQTLTAFALKKWEKEKSEILYFREIPITLFEEYYRKNMEPEDEFEGNLEYLNQYKGFKNK
jgi:hypothetical protein